MIGAAGTIAFLHALVWIKHRKEAHNLLIAIAGLAAAALGGIELQQLRTESVEVYVTLVKIQHIPLAVLLLMLVWYVHARLPEARRSLAIIISVLWGLTVLINFMAPFSIVFTEITQLNRIYFAWGAEYFVLPVGSANPWKIIPDAATVLLLYYFAEAGWQCWKSGNRRRAVFVAGSPVLFMLLAGIHTPLVDAGLVQTPYMISFAFIAMLLSFSIELSDEAIRAADLSRDMKTNEHRWQTLLHNIEMAISEADESGRFTYVNPCLLSMTGYERDELIGRHFLTLYPKEIHERMEKGFRAVWLGAPTSGGSIKMICKDGTQKTVLWSVVILRDREQQPKAILSLGQDITDRETAYQEIRNLKERLEEEKLYLEEEVTQTGNYHNIIGSSDALRYVLTLTDQVAPTTASVLLEGETGVGKELFARAIHDASQRSSMPLVRVNCASIPDNLIESELFGHERGAFTGADNMRKGRFEIADGGTLFLDEVGDMPMDLQAKLLHALEGGEFQRLGGNEPHKSDVRVISATNRILTEEVAEGRFREDLYFRLATFPITIPPLRKRAEDIPKLIEFFVDHFSRKMGKSISTIPRTALNQLTEYHWPGNIRELRNVIERAVITTQGDSLSLPDYSSGETLHPEHSNGDEALESIEKRHITTVLESCGWKIEGPKAAAERLGLRPSTLRNKMKKIGISRP